MILQYAPPPSAIGLMDLLYRVRCGQIATVEIGPLPGLAVELLNSIGRGLPIGAFTLWRTWERDTLLDGRDRVSALQQALFDGGVRYHLTDREFQVGNASPEHLDLKLMSDDTAFSRWKRGLPQETIVAADGLWKVLHEYKVPLLTVTGDSTRASRAREVLNRG
mgnify:CR=1 FL=1